MHDYARGRHCDARIQDAIKLLAHADFRSFHGDGADRKQPVGALVERGELGVEHDVAHGMQRRAGRADQRLVFPPSAQPEPAKHVKHPTAPTPQSGIARQ